MRARMLRAKAAHVHSGQTSKDGVETFVVRIYRRASDLADEPAGTVECVGCGERQGFVGRDELWDRLFIAGAHGHERESPDRASLDR